MDQLPGWLHELGLGLIVTAQLSLVGIVLAVIVAGVAAILAMCPIKPLQWLAIAYVELFRSVPLLAVLIFVYYGLGPLLVKANVSAFWLAAVALALSEGAYLTEIYRGGLRAIPRAQWEAAESLGFGWFRTVWLVVLPQALRPAVPSTLNMLIALIKDSSLASLVAVNEMTLRATILVSETFLPLQVYVLLGLVYLAVVVPLTVLAWWVDKRFGANARGRSGGAVRFAFLRRAVANSGQGIG